MAEEREVFVRKASVLIQYIFTYNNIISILFKYFDSLYIAIPEPLKIGFDIYIPLDRRLPSELYNKESCKR